MCFLCSKFTQNALAAGALPRIPLGELKRSPDPLLISGATSRQGKEKEGKQGGGVGEKGYWGRKEGGKGREEGREGKGKEEGKGGEREFASLALGG